MSEAKAELVKLISEVKQISMLQVNFSLQNLVPPGSERKEVSVTCKIRQFQDLLKDACFLILANNKSSEDGSGSRSAGGINMTIEEITNEFSLYKLCCGRSWHVQECNAKTGDGLMDGLDWLSRQLVAAGVQDVSSLSP